MCSYNGYLKLTSRKWLCKQVCYFKGTSMTISFRVMLLEITATQPWGSSPGRVKQILCWEATTSLQNAVSSTQVPLCANKVARRGHQKSSNTTINWYHSLEPFTVWYHSKHAMNKLSKIKIQLLYSHCLSTPTTINIKIKLKYKN